MISNSNKMQPPLNAWKGWHSSSAGFLKKQEPSKKHPIKKLSLVTEVDEPKTKKVKPKRWNNFIEKFQNLKHKLLSPDSSIRKLMSKLSNLKRNNC